MNSYMSLKDHVYNYIADQIADGTLLPEKKIDEKKICSELNISRTPVREALIQLSSEGILLNVPRKGFVVPSLGEKKAAELYAVIGALDGLAASLACPYITEKLLKNMEFYTSAMDVAIGSNNYEMYHMQQMLFHSTYIDECGNEILVETLDKLKMKFLKKSHIEDDSSKESEIRDILYRTNEEHKEIIRLFRENNAEELSSYINKTHWASDLAHLETIV